MSLARLIPILFISLSGLIAGHGQSTRYVRVSIQEADYDAVKPWLETDHVGHVADRIIVETKASSLDKLDQYGIPHEILIDDMTIYYQEQNHKFKSRSYEGVCPDHDVTQPLHFSLGSMGGYLTLEELKAELKKMHDLYPDLITGAQPISKFRTYEGRPVLWISMSGNGGIDNDKKGVLYTALHHAREPLGMQQMVYFMWYMLENYATDPKIRKIMDRTVLYFIPCVNPDGYAYNSRVSPDGGGMWRKNRRPLGNDLYGVDLNRNYGFEWGYNNSGSSNDPASDLYRGTSAFSEPEIQAVKWFCENHTVSVALNYHAYGDYLIYPWGYTTEVTGSDINFKSLAKSLTFEKRILYGTSRETVLYTTNGDADDWMYGETGTKNRIFSMTPEVGPSEYGFWPPKDQVEMLCARELRQNIRMAMAPHGFVLMVPSAEPIIHTSNFKHRFYLYPVTIEDGIVQSKITPLTDNIVDFQESLYFFGLGNNEEYEMDIQLKPGLEDGELVRFVMTLDNGELTTSDTVTYIYSNSNEAIDVLSRSTDIENWVRSSQSSNSWGSTNSAYYSEPSCITDSPRGLYSTAGENYIISSESYHIPREQEVFLTFKTKWDITFGEDFAQLSISTDGVHFSPLCGRLTTANFNYKGDISPVYTGIQEEWLTEKISLNDYKGEDVFFKWNMVSQSAEARDGIFVDDMKITYSQTITSSGNDLVKWNNQKLYPNPVYGQVLYLELSDHVNDDQVIRYEIRNQLGQLMGSGVPSGRKSSISVANYPAGVYFMELITSTVTRTEARRFVVLP